MRTAEPRALDAPLVAALTDAWAPAAFVALGRFVAAPTLDLTIHFRRPLPVPGMAPEDYVLGRFHSRLSVAGVWEEDGELWTPARRADRAVAPARARAGAAVLSREGYLGLGSNVGDRRANLQAAVDALGGHGVEVLASSSVYDTEPVGEVLDQPDFLNACLRVRTALEPEALLDACKAVERELGRAAGGVRHGPRPIDVDLLLLGDETYRSERLSLPHEQVTSRRFVLVPLLELEPALVVPGAGRAADALATAH